VWYFTLHYFAVNFGMQEPFFSIDSVPQLSKFGFTQFQIVFLYIAPRFQEPFTVNGIGRNRFPKKTAFNHSNLDNTVKCQSIIHQRVFACRPDIGINALWKAKQIHRLIN
jgi:hypothetical protein